MEYSFSKSNLSKEFISKFLLDRYHNYLTSVSRLPQDVSYIECRDKNDNLKDIFPISYNTKEKYVKIENKFYLDLENKELEALLSFLFKEYGVSNVKVSSIFKIDNIQIRYPNISLSDNVDNIAELPSTFKEYIDSLGKQTKNMPNII